MTVQNQNVKNVYRGNGSTTVFPFTFAINESHPEYIHVYITNDGGKAAETTDFTCDMETRTITYPKVSSSAPKLSATQRLTIYRLLPYEQNLNLVNQGPFFSEDVETQLDDLEMQIQQLSENLVRCFQIGIEAQDFDMTMELEPGKVICVNSEGNGFEAREAMMEVNGAWDGEGRRIESVADPAAAQDVVTKKYVDTLTDNNFMKLQPDGTAWEGRNLPISNVAGPALIKDAANKDYVDRILAGYSGYGERLAIFDNVAQMQAAELVPSQMAVTLGYHDVNDGGAGVYTIRDKGADTPDGGSIIEITGTDYVAKLIPNGTVNVKQFGAKGDGTHDDTRQIQAAIDFVPLGGTVIIPPATYRAAVVVHRNDITITGYGACLKCPTNSNKSVVEVGWVDYQDYEDISHHVAYEKVNIFGLEIDGNYDSNLSYPTDMLGHGIIITAVSKSNFRDIYAHNCAVCGIDDVIDSNYNNIVDCVVEDCGKAMIYGGHYSNFDVNSSKYCRFSIISKGGFYGCRILDNCIGNIADFVVKNASFVGVTINAQTVNHCYGNNVNATIDGGCSMQALLETGSANSNLITASVENITGNVAFLNGAGSKVKIFSNSNPNFVVISDTAMKDYTLDVTATNCGTSLASGASMMEIKGSNNKIDFTFDTDLTLRPILFLSTSSNNIANILTYGTWACTNVGTNNKIIHKTRNDTLLWKNDDVTQSIANLTQTILPGSVAKTLRIKYRYSTTVAMMGYLEIPKEDGNYNIIMIKEVDANGIPTVGFRSFNLSDSGKQIVWYSAYATDFNTTKTTDNTLIIPVTIESVIT